MYYQTLERNLAIRKDFYDLRDKQGKSKFKSKRILADKFNLTTKRIGEILESFIRPGRR